MKRGIACLILAAAALVGSSLLARRRKQQAWETEVRGEAEWPVLQMESAPASGAAAPTNATGADSASTTTSAGSVESLPDGACPTSHPVKAKKRSGIYHIVGNLAYERTKADRCYLDADAAEADGFRAAKS